MSEQDWEAPGRAAVEAGWVYASGQSAFYALPAIAAVKAMRGEKT